MLNSNVKSFCRCNYLTVPLPLLRYINRLKVTVAVRSRMHSLTARTSDTITLIIYILKKKKETHNKINKALLQELKQ